MYFEFDYSVTTDDGALSSGTADSAGYGSYHLEARTRQKQTVRLDFGSGVTNNEAEYRTLIAGLKDVVGHIERAGKAPSTYSLFIHTDSHLLVGQCTRGWQVKAAKAGSQGARCMMRAAIWGIAIQVYLLNAPAIYTERAMAGFWTRDPELAPGPRSA
jgi:ribonuclease HI